MIWYILKNGLSYVGYSKLIVGVHIQCATPNGENTLRFAHRQQAEEYKQKAYPNSNNWIIEEYLE